MSYYSNMLLCAMEENQPMPRLEAHELPSQRITATPEPCAHVPATTMRIECRECGSTLTMPIEAQYSEVRYAFERLHTHGGLVYKFS